MVAFATSRMDTDPAAGRAMADIRVEVCQGSSPVMAGASAAEAVLLMPQAGPVTARAADGTEIVSEGRPVLLARAGRRFAVTGGVVVTFRRMHLQAIISRRLREARHLAGVECVLQDFTADGLTARLAGWRSGVPSPSKPPVSLVTAFYEALAEHCLLRPDTDPLFVSVRSVNEALHRIHGNPAYPWSTEELATSAGVAPATLRKNFKTSFGLSLSDFICGFRLDCAHQRLTSGFESQPISRLAIVAGFRDAVAFTRAYKRRFGNSPSQARAEAVRAMR